MAIRSNAGESYREMLTHAAKKVKLGKKKIKPFKEEKDNEDE